MHAARGGHCEVTKVLLEAGAPVEAKDRVSRTIYIFACVCVCGGEKIILPSYCMI